METYSRASETDTDTKKEHSKGRPSQACGCPGRPSHLPQTICSSSLCSGWAHRNLFKNSLAHTQKQREQRQVPAKPLAGLEVLPARRGCLQTRVAKQPWSEAPPSSTVCQQFNSSNQLPSTSAAAAGVPTGQLFPSLNPRLAPSISSPRSLYSPISTHRSPQILPHHPQEVTMRVSWQLSQSHYDLRQIYAPRIPIKVCALRKSW